MILAHRLLKNRLEAQRAYVLLTEAALTWIGVDPLSIGLMVHTEHYEHLGDIRCVVWRFDRADRERLIAPADPALSRVA